MPGWGQFSRHPGDPCKVAGAQSCGCVFVCAGVCAVEKRAAEMDLALAPERQWIEFCRWFGGSTGQGWLGCVGAGCGGCAVLCGSLHCLRCVYDSHATASDPLSGLRRLAARHRESGCNILIVHTYTGTIYMPLRAAANRWHACSPFASSRLVCPLLHSLGTRAAHKQTRFRTAELKRDRFSKPGQTSPC